MVDESKGPVRAIDFTIEHRRGKDNVVPDVLSRIHEDENEIYSIELEVLSAIDLDSKEFDYPEYVKLRERYEKCNMPDFKVLDKFVYKRTEFSEGKQDESDSWKLWVPELLRNQVMYSAHNVPGSAHGGIARTLERIRRYFFWPRLVLDVRIHTELRTMQDIENTDFDITSSVRTNGADGKTLPALICRFDRSTP